MKKTLNTLQLAAILLLLLTGIFSSCGKEDDIDMSKIDFSNIENLYAQPLSVIQKAVQGKWKRYQTCDGVVGCVYPKDCFLEYTDNNEIWNDETGNIYNRTFYWKKVQIPMNDKIVNTYAIYSSNTEDTSPLFTIPLSIVNDTLYMQGCYFNPYYIIIGSTCVRIGTE
ncbi:MAG: hypothetical protein LBJ63_01510 [Prevotellaceae bacterium]|nr:hypothetical protein [Prevotellaceae bacterium]